MTCKKCGLGLSSGECFEDYDTGSRLLSVISGTEGLQNQKICLLTGT
jgi:hypothetical protein